MILPGGDFLVSAGSSCTIISQAQTYFRPRFLYIPPDVGAHFTITDIRIGNNSYMISAGDVPACLFSKFSEEILDDAGRTIEPIKFLDLKAQTASPGMEISVHVKNNFLNALWFRYAFIGDAGSAPAGVKDGFLDIGGYPAPYPLSADAWDKALADQAVGDKCYGCSKRENVIGTWCGACRKNGGTP